MILLPKVNYRHMTKQLKKLDDWPTGLHVEVAINESASGLPCFNDEELAAKFDLPVEELERLKSLVPFRAAVRQALGELKGEVLHRKTSALDEFVVDTFVLKWLRDENFPAAEKVKIWKHLTDMHGGITDKKVQAALEQAVSQKTSAPSLTLILQQSDGTTKDITAASSIIEHEPITH